MTERLAYTIGEAAESLGVSVSWVRRAIDDGLLRTVQRRSGGRILIPATALEEFLAGDAR